MTTDKNEWEDWLGKGKWTKFLMSLPLGQTTIEMTKVGEYVLPIIRVTASGLTNNEDCDRGFSLTVDRDRRYLAVKAWKKK